MKKIIQSFLSLGLVFSLTGISVTACAKEGISLASIATHLDLGYLDNLRSETILNKFLELNPNVKGDLLSEEVGGNGYRGKIGTTPPYNRGYRPSDVFVTYHSKLGFGNADNSTFPITFANQDDKHKFLIQIAVLDLNYNKDRDGVVYCRNGSIPDWFNLEIIDDRISDDHPYIDVIVSLGSKISELDSRKWDLYIKWSQGIILVYVEITLAWNPVEQ